MANDYYKQFGGTQASFMTKQTIGMALPINYRVDGTGRDTYIRNNNGGLYISHQPANSCQKGEPFRTVQRPPSALCNLGTKRNIYHCNRTGRDNYAQKSELPTYVYSAKETEQNFISGFRTYSAKCNPSDYARPVATKKARNMSKISSQPVDSYLHSQTFHFKDDALRQSNACLLAY